ncbi:hypothetical protein HDU86_005351 [Geranomyces michiganensis]|nr:hypothetical protein HDU86_005351 [Geranomyces michiganensis]
MDSVQGFVIDRKPFSLKMGIPEYSPSPPPLDRQLTPVLAEDKFLGTVVRTAVFYQKENGDIYQLEKVKVTDLRGDPMPCDGKTLWLELPDGNGFNMSLPQ